MSVITSTALANTADITGIPFPVFGLELLAGCCSDCSGGVVEGSGRIGETGGLVVEDEGSVVVAGGSVDEAFGSVVVMGGSV
ncbi:MAG: hypothetical protein FWF82_02625, partial [Oscillospiraceae bacterium]|nr:hypothetical protein [Oscillospiraceae bacterium]